MKLVCHGGKCCGIKTIHTFPFQPDTITPALTATATSHGSFSSTGYDNDGSRPAQAFYYLAIPRETGERRLDRYLAYCDRRRPHGIVEVTLTTSQVDRWKKTLTDRNFKEVNRCKNSNTQNTVVIYHRNSGEVPAITFEEEKEEKSANPEDKDAKARIQVASQAQGDTETVAAVSPAVVSPTD